MCQSHLEVTNAPLSKKVQPQAHSKQGCPRPAPSSAQAAKEGSGVTPRSTA